MRIANAEFRPGLWPSLITLVFLVLLLSLGFWQLERAKEKRALLAGFHADRDGRRTKAITARSVRRTFHHGAVKNR